MLTSRRNMVAGFAMAIAIILIIASAIGSEIAKNGKPYSMWGMAQYTPAWCWWAMSGGIAIYVFSLVAKGSER